jgi:hypothetical protein
VRASLASLLLLACGAPPPSVTPTVVPEPADVMVATAAPLRLQVRTRLVSREGEPGLLFRITNESTRALLVDLRDVDRVVRASDGDALRLPLSDEQVSELSEISALREVRPGRSIAYATPFDGAACDGSRTVRLGGVLVALDGDRVIELVADGVEVSVSCEPPSAILSGASWVATTAPFAAEGRAPASFAEGLPDLVRAASVSDGADVSLLAFSYDPRPIERWRYDACVSLGRCSVRVVPQPPGSIQRPAVGMDAAGTTAFCESRGMRTPSEAETTAIGDPPRALLESAPDGVVTGGFRCVRAEAP